MPDNNISVLMLGDIIGKPGFRAVISTLSRFIRQYRADCVIINGENAADGFGITPDIAGRLFHAGVSVITTGNHVWRQKEIRELLEREPRLLRPQNYPVGESCGKGFITIEVKQHPFTVVNLQGRRFMGDIDCPFRTVREVLRKVVGKMIIIDFHAESTHEKEALGHYLSKKVSAVMGTHTHVQTGDLKILENHTGYCTDIGSCGSPHGVIGFDPESSKRLFLTQVHQPFVVDEHPASLQGVHMRINPSDGQCSEVNLINHHSKV